MLPSRIPAAVPLIVACGLFMEHLDSTVIATALPQIARSMGEPPIHLSMAMTVYMLSLAVFLPVSGWAADRFGVRTVFASAIAVFTASSLLCGLSDGLWELVAARALQGMGGAMMVPVGRLAIIKTVPKGDLVKAMSLVTMPALVGPALGPLVGGFIATYWSWRYIFYVNIPIGVFGMAMTMKYIPNLREKDLDPFDLRGSILSGLTLLGFVFGLENVGRGLLDPVLIVAILAAAAILGLLYVRHARSVARPALDLGLFKAPTFAASVGGGTFFRIGIGATPFLLPMLLQVGFGMTAIESGSLTFVGAVGAMTMKVAAPSILRRFGFRRLLMWNAVISGVFLMSFGLFRPGTPHLVIMGALLVSGFFRSLQFTALNTLAYAEIPQRKASRASTLSSVMQQLSLSLGIASGALILITAKALAGTDHLLAGQFTPAFVYVGLMACLSAVFFVRLSADAGQEISGHRAMADGPEAER